MYHKLFLAFLVCLLKAVPAPGQPATENLVPPAEVLSQEEWQQVDSGVERGLAWLAAQQQRDGSFATLPQGQPGVTSLCLMAFVAHGHMPGSGPYGEQLEKAVKYILSCQQENGLIALVGPRGKQIHRNVSHEIGSTATYNHALSALVLSEVFAMGQGSDIEQMQSSIEKAIGLTLEMQTWPKDRGADRGGWRYVDDFNHEDSDLSVSGWHLMFLRSAKNAGFDVQAEPIEKAVEYVQRCYRPRFQTFLMLAEDDTHRSRAMAGAGILALAHAGMHDSPEAKAAGEWLLRYEFTTYNESLPFDRPQYHDDRYHYGAFVCTQAMYQLGGHFWQQFYPPTVRTLLRSQSAEGAWLKENHQYDAKFGTAYTSALALLTLGAPNQLLPIFQR